MQRIHALIVGVCSALMFVSCATTSPEQKVGKAANKYVKRGNEYAKDGLLREAADTYKKALSINPKDATVRRNLGIVLVKSRSYKEAVRQLEKAIGMYEKDFEANFYLAEAYRASDKYAEAIYRYKKALSIDKKDTRSMKALAWSYFKIRYYAEALTMGKKLRRIAPNDGQVSIILARTLLKLKRPKSALKVLRKAKRASDKDSLPYFNSVEGDILQAMNQCTNAIAIYKEALKVQPLLAGSLLGLGKCYLDNGMNKKAIDYLQRAARVRPQLAEPYYLLGKAYETTDKRKAVRLLKHFRKIVAKDPEFLSRLPDVNARIAELKRSSTPTAKAMSKDKRVKK